MSLVYRAIWQDDRAELIQLSEHAFCRWALDTHGHQVIENGDTATVTGDLRVGSTIARTESDSAAALQATLRVDSGDERTVTTLRSIVRAGQKWLWVDVERVSADIWDRSLPEAPRLVHDLVAGGERDHGDPRWGAVRLTTRPRVANPKALAASCLNLLFSPRRETPIVVFAHDYGADPATNMARAAMAAEQLVGVAPVLVIPGVGLTGFNQAVGDELQVAPGEVRVIGPDPHDPRQQRLLDAGFVRRYPDQVGRRICASLVQALASRRAPAVYDDIRRMFRDASSRSDAELLSAYEAELTSRDTEIAHLHTVITVLEEEKLSALAEVESLQEQQTKLQEAVVQLLHPGGHGEKALGEPDTVADAIEMADRFLDGVVIAGGASRDVVKLDQAAESRAWARTIWSGLLALDAYATEAGTFRGSFYDWCRNSGHRLVWPSGQKKLAMSESETVMSVERLRRHRMLPVDWRVDARGRVVMEAHLKVSSGSLAPRVYFHDDSGGPTGKVHIGFIGPHEHMPTKRS